MQNIQEKKLLWTVVLFLLLKPIYLFSSGGVQICDIFLIICIFWNIIKTKGKICLNYINIKFIFVFACLVSYQLLVNIIWYSIDLDTSFLLKTLFYVYNFFAFLFFVHITSLSSIDNLKVSIAYGAFLSSCVSLIGIIFNTGSAIRGVGFFNNPNQLGFHGILIFTLIFFTKDYLPKFIKWITLILSIILVLASASKAAFIGIVFLSIVYVLFSEDKINIQKIVVKLFLLALLGTLLYSFFFIHSSLKTDNNIIATMQYRLFNMIENPTSDLATGRGYARISEMGIHFPWGMGEGDYGRFSTLSFLEVHSSFINLFVSYGIIGFIGYMYIFGYVLILWNNLKISLYNLLGFSGIIIYSFTHNSIRNTVIFLLLVLLFLQKNNKKIKKENK